MSHYARCILAVISLLTFTLSSFSKPPQDHDGLVVPTALQKIAIANYGPHSSLDDTITGLKEELATLGFINMKNISFHVSHVNFEATLIQQMLAKLKAEKPQVLVALTTPVAQAAKHMLRDIPLVFASITDPVRAGLIKEPKMGEGNITGASDKQDLAAFLSFVKNILPQAKTVGLLYATGEDNDLALVDMMKSAAASKGMNVLAVSIDHPRDISVKMSLFKGKVDFIYVGASGPIQPSLPAIVREADRFKIPVFNLDEKAVYASEVLGSFAVSYKEVGRHVGQIVSLILKGKKPDQIPIFYPSLKDHKGFLSRSKAKKLGITLPSSLAGTTIVN